MTDIPPIAAAEPNEGAEPPNPLAGLGLGHMWRPTPTDFAFHTLMPPGQTAMHVLQLTNAGGSFGGTFNRAQLVKLIDAATEALAKGEAADSARVMRAAPPKLFVPGANGQPTLNRAQRRRG